MIIPKNFKRVDLEHAPTIQALKTGFKAYKYPKKEIYQIRKLRLRIKTGVFPVR